MRLGGDRNTPRRGLSFLYTSESFSQKYLRDATNGKHRSHKPFLAFVTVGDAYSVTGGGGPDRLRLPPGCRSGRPFFRCSASGHTNGKRVTRVLASRSLAAKNSPRQVTWHFGLLLACRHVDRKAVAPSGREAVVGFIRGDHG